jgi:SAM-dependent methyltransferase
MTARLAPWALRCDDCGTWASTLEPVGGEVDTDVRAAGLEPLRRHNFRLILDALERRRPLRGARLLDVGSAHGWFLEEAAQRGAVTVGIEPDARVATRIPRDDVRIGYFPEALRTGEQFDVIAFNDVLEHIPDVRAVLDTCAATLAPQGLLSVNIPTSDGLAFKLACALKRIGVAGPFERLWQYGLGSPHLHYFPRAALVALLGRMGFEAVDVRALPAVTTSGLWERVHTLGRPSPATVTQFAALRLAAPLLNREPASDIVHLVARTR